MSSGCLYFSKRCSLVAPCCGKTVCCFRCHGEVRASLVCYLEIAPAGLLVQSTGAVALHMHACNCPRWCCPPNLGVGYCPPNNGPLLPVYLPVACRCQTTTCLLRVVCGRVPAFPVPIAGQHLPHMLQPLCSLLLQRLRHSGQQYARPVYFRCDACGVCREGIRQDFFHCHGCGCCIRRELQGVSGCLLGLLAAAAAAGPALDGKHQSDTASCSCSSQDDQG
jgi:hypothetical protein